VSDAPSVPTPAGEPEREPYEEREPQDAVARPPAARAHAQQRPQQHRQHPRPPQHTQGAQHPQHHPQAKRGSAPPPPDWQRWQPRQPPPPAWIAEIKPVEPATVTAATLWSVLGTALLSSLLLGEGLGVNLLVVALAAALAAYFAATAAGRRPRPWTVVWALGGLALLAVPALRDAGLPTFLALVSALALGSLALHGSRRWPGILFGPPGLVRGVGQGVSWGWRGLRERADGSRGRWMPVVRTVVVAAVLLIVFGALFASADAAFSDLIGDLSPDVSVSDGPWRFLLFALGLLGALTAAHTAAAPLRWDRVTVKEGRPRARLEWALPLIILNLLFAAFIVVQLAVLFGGYDKILRETGLTYSEYARQGFWQLLWVTLLVIVVIALAKRWAPRDGARDHTLVRVVLGVLCALTLVVVVSTLRRMDLYVDAYGLTRLRVSVAATEIWLGVVVVLILVAGAVGVRWLPRAVAASAGAAVLAFGLLSPDALVAERNQQRYETSGKIDIQYLQVLSADAVPALDRLPEPVRSCALVGIERNLGNTADPWYATSWSESRARDILAKRPVDTIGQSCASTASRFGDATEESGAGGGEPDPR
jgi:hypothetical protein